MAFIVHLRDGKTLKESDGINWTELPLQEITSLQISHSTGKTYTVSVDGKNVELIQLKRALIDFGRTGKGRVLERVIGFIYNNELAIKLEVDEKTGNVKLTCEKKVGNQWRRL